MICKSCFSIIPQNKFELLQRAQQLAGQNLASLAAQLNLSVPINLKRNKGWIGRLLELHLGAKGGNKGEQDFYHLGIELKTIPVDIQGKPIETTFVCVAQMTGNNGITWKNSNVWRKLSHVLWIPIEGDSIIPLPKRRVGSPLLWQPSEKEETQLSKDWEELMDMIVLGQVESINAFYGEWLQIRPKAVNRNSLTKAVGNNGKLITTLPRAFYLRRRFTQILLERHFLL